MGVNIVTSIWAKIYIKFVRKHYLFQEATVFQELSLMKTVSFVYISFIGFLNTSDQGFPNYPPLPTVHDSKTVLQQLQIIADREINAPRGFIDPMTKKELIRTKMPNLLFMAQICQNLSTCCVCKIVIVPHFISCLHEFSFKFIILLKETYKIGYKSELHDNVWCYHY